MWDDSFKRDPLNRNERVIYTTSLVVILCLFGAEVVFDYEPRKLSAVFFILSWMVLVAIHELGHAMMAWLCGWGVKKIVVGFGRELFRTKVNGVPMEWRTFPIEGFVQTYPLDLKSPRAKDALIYSAGPGIELVLAAIITSTVGWSMNSGMSDITSRAKTGSSASLGRVHSRIHARFSFVHEAALGGSIDLRGVLWRIQGIF